MILRKPDTAIALPTGDGWPVASSRPLGSVAMSEGIRRALNSEHYDGARNRNAVRAWVYRLARQWSGSGEGPARVGDRFYFPAAMHPALSEPARQATDAPALKSISADRRNRALAKHRALLDFKAFHELGGGRELGKCAALQRFVMERATAYTFRDGASDRTLSLSERSMQEWERKLAAGGLDALGVDGRGQYGREQPDEAAADLYWTLRNDPRKFKLTSCWRQVAFAAKQNGWRWFEALSTCRAWDKARRNERGLVLNQCGDLAFAARSAPYHQPNPESFEPNERWEGDHTTANVWVQTRAGVSIRPVVTVFKDWRSRKIVGATVVSAGNAESILVAFRNGARRDGLPSSVKIDNGRDFVAWSWIGGRPKRHSTQRAADFTERWTGLFRMLGVEPSLGLPYNPNAKGRIERGFRDFDEQFAKFWPSYCAGRPDDRPEAHADLVAKAVPIDEFVARLHEWIDVFNNTPHSGDGMNGHTPSQIMALATRRRVLTDDQAGYLLASWPRPLKIGRHGIALRYAGGTLRFGDRSPELLRLPIGTEVRVAFDPDDLKLINVWTLNGKWICSAKENHHYDQKLPGEALRESFREERRFKRQLREVRRKGLEHLAADPVKHAIAASAADAARRRKPDPPSPPGGPVLVPIQTPFESPTKEVAALRKAVGAPEGIVDMNHADINRRMAAFAEKCATEQRAPRSDGRASLLKRLAETGKK